MDTLLVLCCALFFVFMLSVINGFPWHIHFIAEDSFLGTEPIVWFLSILIKYSQRIRISPVGSKQRQSSTKHIKCAYVLGCSALLKIKYWIHHSTLGRDHPYEVFAHIATSCVELICIHISYIYTLYICIYVNYSVEVILCACSMCIH